MGTGRWKVLTTLDSVMTWNFGIEHVDLRALYEKAKREQWNATTRSTGHRMSTQMCLSSTMILIPMLPAAPFRSLAQNDSEGAAATPL